MNKVISKFVTQNGKPRGAITERLGLRLVFLCSALLTFPVAAQIDCDNNPRGEDLDILGLSTFLDASDDGQQRILIAPILSGVLGEQGVIGSLLNALGLEVVDKLVYQSLWVLAVPIGEDLNLIVDLLNSSPLIRYVEVDRYRSPHSIPNDSLSCNQWYVENTAGSYYGRAATSGADLKLSLAWNISTGSEQVVIAVIDNGADLSHPDLSNNLWVNVDEVPGNGVDDDLNGYVDDVHGWDFNRNDNDPSPESSGRNHGTAVTGAFGAVGNNAVGIAGANWSVSTMVLKTDYSVSATIKAMEYAASKGAHIINTSFGGSEFSQSEYTAIDVLRSFGILVVASAGNEHWDNDFGPNYPASYDLPNIISVAATSTRDDFTAWTQHGQISVDVAAPGDVIITTEANGSGGDDSYAVRSGTSFASPLVAGVAGLIKSQYPEASFDEIKARILASVDPVSDAQCAIGSGGRVNALAAVEMSEQPVPTLTGVAWVDGGNNLPDPGESAEIKLTFDMLWGDAGAGTAAIVSQDPAIVLLSGEVGLPALASGESFAISIAAKASAVLSGHNRVPLTVSFNSPGFAAERTVCLVAAPLQEGQQIQSTLQRSQLDDVQRFHIEVPEGVPGLILDLSSDRNVDLYARFGDWPKRDEVLRNRSGYERGKTTHISAHDDGEESLVIADPAPGTWYVMVVNAGQLTETQYTLAGSFATPVADHSPDEGGQGAVKPEAEAEGQVPTGVDQAVAGSGGGGGASVWLLLLVLRLLKGRRHG